MRARQLSVSSMRSVGAIHHRCTQLQLTSARSCNHSLDFLRNQTIGSGMRCTRAFVHAELLQRSLRIKIARLHRP